MSYFSKSSLIAGAAIFVALSSGAQAQVETVTVTAERTEQKAVDVPVSFVVVSGDQLKNTGYAGLTDLQFLTPSVSYNDNFGGGFEIRGVGTQSVNVAVEQSVSVVIDDVVQGLPQISFAGPSYQALTDISRIEILRGPQGTLFGKNSSAGVIQVVTKKPDLDNLTFDGSASYGTDNEIRLYGNANVPLGDDAAVRVSAFEYRRDGFVHNLFTGKDISGYLDYGFRGKFLWEPTNDLEVYLIAGYTKNHDDGNGIWTLRSCGSGFKGGLGVFRPCAEAAKYGIVPGPKNLSGDWDGPNFLNEPDANASAHISYKLGPVTLESITAWEDINLREAVEVDSSDLPILSQNQTLMLERQWSQEFRGTGTADVGASWLKSIDYTGGLFYFNTAINYYGEQAGTYNYLPANGTTLLTSGVGGQVPCCATLIPTRTTSYAAYGQVNLHILDNLSLIGGLRYTDDRNTTGTRGEPSNVKNLVTGYTVCQFAFAFGAPCLPTTLPSPLVSKSISANNVSGKGTIQYYVTPEINVYATYATGYKGPSISYPRGLPLVPVLPETSEDIEIGTKGTAFDDMLQFDADLFRTNYSNFQGQALYTDPSNPANRAYVTTNAGGLKTQGFEANLTYLPTTELSFTGSYAYTDTSFISFSIPCNDGFTNPATIPGQCTYIKPGSPAGTPPGFNAAGYPLPYSSKNSFNLGADYTRPWSDDLILHASVNYHWQSSYYTVVADPNTIVPAYGVLGASLSFADPAGRFDVTVFARNLLDQYFVYGIFKTPLDTGTAHSTPLSTIGYANQPAIESGRTVGVRLDFQFK